MPQSSSINNMAETLSLVWVDPCCFLYWSERGKRWTVQFRLQIPVINFNSNNNQCKIRSLCLDPNRQIIASLSLLEKSVKLKICCFLWNSFSGIGRVLSKVSTFSWRWKHCSTQLPFPVSWTLLPLLKYSCSAQPSATRFQSADWIFNRR